MDDGLGVILEDPLEDFGLDRFNNLPDVLG